ncbi:MAG: ABC transporter permease [Rhodobacteraceae bacterium]|jgi:putative spermidine/putrescine transport system permease protein|nr:ABC transporter permease [Paracoccaceae bacterium]
MKPETLEQLRTAAFALPAALFMLVMMAVPLGSVIAQSLSDETGFSLSAYAKIAQSDLFLRVTISTLQIAIGGTVVALLLGYPIAYFLAKQPPRRRAVWMILILIPFWTSALVKSFAFTVLLGHAGIINTLLGDIGLGPYKLLFNRIGVMVGMSHFLVPFMVFPILTNLTGQPPELAKAASIMGAGKLRIFLTVTLPLSLPGVVSGALLVFILALGFYIVPKLLGGRQDVMLSSLVDFYARELIDWQVSSAIAVILMIAALIAAVLLAQIRGGASILSKEAS